MQAIGQGLLKLGGGLLDNLGTTAAVAGGLAGVNQAYSRLGDIGEAAQQGAVEIGEAGRLDAQFKPFTVGVGSSSATPSQYFSSGISVDEQGGLFTDLSAGEQLLKNKLLDDARQRAIVQTDASGSQGLEQAGREALFSGRSMLQNIPTSTADREQAVFDRIRATQLPEEERQRLALEERLFGQGRLGVSSAMFGGTPEQLALAKAQEEARNQASLMAIQQAQRERMDQAALANQTLGLSQNLLAGNLALQGAEQQMGLRALEAAYRPETQQLAALRQGLLGSQIAQRGQLYGTGLYGEAAMGGLEALLKSGIGQADLMGTIGTGLLAGAMTPQQQGSTGGLVNVLSGIGQQIFKTSDVRLKQDINYLGSDANGVKFYTWEWTEEGQKIAGNDPAIGVIAQELQEIMPDAVMEGSDGYLRVDYNKVFEG